MFRQGGRKRHRFLAVIVKDYICAELHSRLHDHADYSVPRGTHILLGEGRAEQVQSMMNLVGCGHGRRGSRKRFTPGSGNLGTNYIQDRTRAWRQIFKCRFGGATEEGSSLRDGALVWATLAVIGTGDTCIEMNLVVSREYARPNQFTGMVHRHLRRLISPRVRAEMVTTEQHAVARKPGMARRGANKLSKLSRSLSGVTTQLIHLA